jgi:hypothetical protein
VVWADWPGLQHGLSAILYSLHCPFLIILKLLYSPKAFEDDGVWNILENLLTLVDSIKMFLLGFAQYVSFYPNPCGYIN